MSLRQRGQRASSSRQRAAVLLILVPVSVPVVVAQQAPVLQHRSAQPQDAPQTAPTAATGHTDLPPAAEGQYPWKSWRGDGEIELYFDSGQLHGYMTEPQSRDNQTGAPLTFNFATTHADGDALSFTTRQLHGAWYSFSGHLERGLASSPSQPGFYRLTGSLAEHGGAQNGMVHTVSLPREPGTD